MNLVNLEKVVKGYGQRLLLDGVSAGWQRVSAWAWSGAPCKVREAPQSPQISIRSGIGLSIRRVPGFRPFFRQLVCGPCGSAAKSPW